MAKKMTQKEYIKRKGLHCPNCESSELLCNGIENDYAGMFQDIECEKCGSTWIEHYALVGYQEFDPNTENGES